MKIGSMIVSPRSLFGILMDILTVVAVGLLAFAAHNFWAFAALTFCCFWFLFAHLAVLGEVKKNLDEGGKPTPLIMRLTAAGFNNQKQVVLLCVMSATVAVCGIWLDGSLRAAIPATVLLLAAFAHLRMVDRLHEVNGLITDKVTHALQKNLGILPGDTPQEKARKLAEGLLSMDPEEAIDTVKAALVNVYGPGIVPGGRGHEK